MLDGKSESISAELATVKAAEEFVTSGADTIPCGTAGAEWIRKLWSSTFEAALQEAIDSYAAQGR